MSGNLKPGVYSLENAASPSPLVGVNFRGVPKQKVVTNAAFRNWKVTQNPDGKYLLAVEDVEGNLVAEGEDNVVFAVRGPSTTWIVDGPEGGPYTIRAPVEIIPPPVWTVENPDEPGSLVTLEVLQLNPVPEKQKWYFVAPR